MGQLVSLQGDLNAEIRKDALKLVQIEDERHPTFLDNRLLEGVEMAYLFQIKTIGTSHPVEDCVLLGMGPSSGMGPGSDSSHGMGPGSVPSSGMGPSSGFDGEIISIFGALYTTCIQPNKKRRNDFLIGLLKRALQISQLLKIKNQSSGSSPRNLSEKISPYLSKKTKVKSVNENGNDNNNEINEEEEKNNNHRNKDNKKNDREKEKEIYNKNKNNDMIVEESDHLNSLLSFILTTLSHLPFETVDEPMQVSTVT